MKERPILMSAPMVLAILAGTKTQTRRVVKGAPDDWAPIGPEVFSPTIVDRHGEEQPGADAYGAGDVDGDCWISCPYGQPSDKLWVRETWAPLDERALVTQRRDGIAYAASTTSEGNEARKAYGVRWRPSIHMPRWASRITLEVTEVRVERLQDISAGDAIAEGVNVHPDHHDKPRTSIYSPVQAYRDLWAAINGAGSWDANPWVWCVSFRWLAP